MAQLRRAVVQAPAKINLALDITGEDGTGYHRLDTVMHTINLYDTLHLELHGGEGVTVTCTDAAIPTDESNLAVKAAKVFFGRTGIRRGLAIHIEKRIPAQAGLAGGSADAAAVLAGLSRLLEGPEGAALAAMGLEVGSDVPFCLVGRCARATGRGETLELLPLLPQKVQFVVAKPAGGMSTKEAFSLYDRYPGDIPRPDLPGLVQALSQGDWAGVGRRMVNVFTPVCAPPQVTALLEILRVGGAIGAEMTGTGTAAVGLFSNEMTAARCLRALGRLCDFSCLCRPANYGARVQTLE